MSFGLVSGEIPVCNELDVSVSMPVQQSVLLTLLWLKLCRYALSTGGWMHIAWLIQINKLLTIAGFRRIVSHINGSGEVIVLFVRIHHRHSAAVSHLYYSLSMLPCESSRWRATAMTCHWHYVWFRTRFSRSVYDFWLPWRLSDYQICLLA